MADLEHIEKDGVEDDSVKEVKSSHKLTVVKSVNPKSYPGSKQFWELDQKVPKKDMVLESYKIPKVSKAPAADLSVSEAVQRSLQQLSPTNTSATQHHNRQEPGSCHSR